MTWQFVAHDLRTNTYLGDLPAKNVRWAEGENAASTLEFGIDLAETADDGTRLGGQYREMLQPGKTKVTVLRNGNPIVGSHIVWDHSYDGRHLDVKCAGMWSYFANRRLTVDRDFDNVDQHTIARDLIGWAQQAQGNIGLQLAAGNSGVTRVRNYLGYEEQVIADLVGNLANVIGGFEFAVTTSYVNDVPVSTWRPYYPRRGRPYSQTSLEFTLGENLGSYELATDAPTTTMRGVGAGEGTTMLRASDQRADLLGAGWPILEGSYSRKDVSVQATLDSHAQADLRKANADAERWTLRLVAPDDMSVPFGAWQIGDDAKIIIPAGVDWLWPEGREVIRRIVGQQVEMSDDGGIDRVSLTMGALRG